MRTLLVLIFVGGVLLSWSAPVAAQDREATWTAPPSRPLPITAGQSLALERLTEEPQHSVVADARASYSPEAARTLTEIGVYASQAVMPGAILAVLIAAAPL